MKPPAALRTIGTTLALLACGSLAIAGGMPPDETARAHAHASAPAVTSHASAPDDAPGYPQSSARAPGVGARASSTPATHVQAAPASPCAPQPPAGDTRPEKRERGRPAPTTALHGHRATPQRSKGAQRNTPATPGMGQLLRMGAGAGRELSLLLEHVSCAPASMRSGRAPPRAGPHPNPARDPIACAAALPPPTVTPPSNPQGVTPPTHHTFRSRSADPPQGWQLARVDPAAASRTGHSFAHFPKRVARFHAERLKGATACTASPFGGFRT